MKTMFNQKPKKQESFGSKLFKTGLATAGLAGVGYVGWKNKKRLGGMFKTPQKIQTPIKPSVTTNPLDDAYKYFAVDKTADKKAIKTKYKQMAKQYHPDHGGNIDDFKKLNTNYDLLRTHVGFSAFLGDFCY